jgi:hypothetical protein
MEGARGAGRRAFHQGTVAEDRTRVHHAADQGSPSAVSPSAVMSITLPTSRSCMGRSMG